MKFKEIEVANSATNQLNLTEPHFVKTFVDSVNFYDSVRPESVSVGFRHSCIVYDDQSLACAGYNNAGQLGVGYDHS